MIDAASPVSAGADTDADDIASGDVGVDDVIAVADEIIEDDARYVVTIRYICLPASRPFFSFFIIIYFFALFTSSALTSRSWDLI